MIERNELIATMKAAKAAFMTEEQAWETLNAWLGEKTVLPNGVAMAVLNIITDEPSGSHPDSRHPAFNRLEEVVEVERQPIEKWVPVGEDTQKRVSCYRYRAFSRPYEANGKTVRDETRSGPEEFVDGEPKRAATALLGRLLEAVCADY